MSSKLKPKNIKGIAIEIINGYSSCVMRDGRELFIKHITPKDQNELEIYYNEALDSFSKSGYPTEIDCLNSAIEQEIWSEDFDDELESLEFSISSLRKVLAKSARNYSERDIQRKIDGHQERLDELIADKSDICKNSAERVAQKRQQNFLIYLLFFEDAELSKRVFDREEFDECSEQFLIEYLIKLIEAKERINENALLWAGLSTFIFDVYSSFKDPKMIINKTHCLDVSVNQIEVVKIVKFFSQKIEKVYGMPDSVSSNPYLLIDYDVNKESAKKEDEKEHMNMVKKIQKSGKKEITVEDMR